MKKRILALCLVFCMLLSMLPTAVFAAETTPAEAAEIQPAAEAPDAAVALAAVTADGVCGEKLIWALNEEGVLTITGSGNMDDYTIEEPAPWNKYKESITGVILGDEVTGIGAYAFYGLTKLTEVEFSDTVLTIGEAAFCSCEALAEVQLPEGCTTIGENAFTGTLWTAENAEPTDASEGEAQAADPAAEEIEQAPAEEAGEPQQIDAGGNDADAAEAAAADSNEEAGEAEQTAPKGNAPGEELPTPAEAPAETAAAEGVAADDEAVELAETPLTITKQPAAVSAKVGETAKFTVTATGTGLKYQWQYSTDSGKNWSNSPATGSTTATVSISVAANKNGYLYHCVITDSNGKTVTSNAAKLTVFAITKQPADASAKVGATAKFTVTATGTSLKYQWQYSTDNGKNWSNSPATGNTTATVSITVAANKNGYQYRCVITDGSGKTINSNAATLTVAAAISNPRVTTDSSMEAGQKATWDCIWFGSYPQAEVVSSKSMMTAAIGEEVLKDNDYIVDATLYSQLKSATGWDKNNEISIGGNKYRRMRKADATQNFLEYDGYYGWSDSTTYHYFKYQPIKWRVLSTDGSTALLLADVCLADIQWNTCTDYGNTWATSQLRSWLNSYGASANTAGDNYSSTGFLSNAFTAAEKSAIVNGTVKNNVTGNYTDGSGTATTDRIFLLSHAEIRKAAYGFSTNADSWDEARRARASTYARAQGAYWSTGSSYCGNSWWWLRSAGVSSSLSSDVIGGGGNCLCHSVDSEDNAVRPALKITLSSVCWDFAGTVSSNGTAAEQQPSAGPSITKQPSNASAIADATAKFTVTATGSGLKYQWQYSTDGGKNWSNSPATGNTTATVSITAAANKNNYLYRCVITDSRGKAVTSNIAKLTVTASALTITKQPSNASAKVGAAAKFTVTATGTSLKYQWQYSTDSGKNWSDSPAEGNTTATVSITVAANKNGYQYRCVITDINKKTVTSSAAKLTVLPAITQQPINISAKVGETAKFTVTATGSGLKYQWQYSTDGGKNWSNSPAEGNTTATVSITVATNKNGYQYRCVITDSNKKTINSNAAKLTVLPSITKQPVNVQAKAGSIAKFTVTATGSSLKYQWQYSTDSGKNWSNSPATGNTTATVSISVAENKNGYQYRCVITDSNGKLAISDAATLTVSAVLNPRVVSDSSMNAKQKTTWDCIWFGSYPQAEVVSSTSMMTAAVGAAYLNSDDYIVDAALYSQLQSATGWSTNNEITIDGSKYRRMLRNDATCATLNVSAYYNWTDSTTYHYFKYQPIKWRVLSTDGSTALLLADECLDDIAWNTSTDYGNDWKYSQMRSFLNSYTAYSNTAGTSYSITGFLGRAFTSAEQSAIVNGVVKNNVTANNTDGCSGSVSTSDRIFLLSYEEIQNAAYGFNASSFNSDEARRSRVSTYARAQGIYWTTDSTYPNYSWWWLRSSGSSATNAWFVYGYGDCASYKVNHCSAGVRPALKIKLSSSCWRDAGTVCSDGTVNELGNGKKGSEIVLKPDTPVNAEINAAGGYSYLAFTPTVSGSYSLYSTSSTDTYGYLYDSNYTQLEQNDDSGEVQNFKITYTLTAGKTYYYGVRFYSNSKTGAIPVTLVKN